MHLGDRSLLGLVGDQFAVGAAPEAERPLPAEKPASRLLVGLHL